jgi:putative hydrolase of the HAD superfamily
LIIIFDLDDTLYSRQSFVNEAIKNIVDFVYLINKKKSKKTLFKILSKIYKNSNIQLKLDFFLKEIFLSKKYLKDCINIFRYSKKKLSLYRDAQNILKIYKKKCYFITDGNKLVQNNKIKKLGIKKFFKKILITNNYGIKYQKPSLFCFKKIKEIEKCSFDQMVYVGDNPKKDFVNCNKVGMLTVRLLRGEFKTLKVARNFDAKYKIKNFKEVIKLFS